MPYKFCNLDRVGRDDHAESRKIYSCTALKVKLIKRETNMISFENVGGKSAICWPLKKFQKKKNGNA
jgi:hypothetical protein